MASSLPALPRAAALAALTSLTHGCWFDTDRDLVASYRQDLDAATLSSLRLDVGDGELDVEGVDGLDQIQVDVDLYTQGRERRAEESLRFELVPTQGGEARLTVRFDDPPVNTSADVRVRLPARLGVTGEDGDGAAFLRHIARLDLRDGDGSLEVSDVAEDAFIDDGDGSMLLLDIAGDVALIDGDGRVDVRSVGSLSLTDGEGHLDLRDIAGDVTLRDGDGQIRLEDVGGDVDLEDGEGSIEVVDVAGSVRIVDGDGDIHLERISGEASVDDGDGDIFARDVGALTIVADGGGRVIER
ncbi:MAG: hypothetical protein ACFCGT_06880 [Sandaracinaceae bacterium]